MHTSLDGFVGGPNGEMDWIHVDEEIFDYVGGETDKADTALYGRVTYEMMEAYWPTAGDQPDASKHDIHHSQWYKNVRKVVLSKTLKQDSLKNTKIISDNIAEEIQQIKNEQGENIIMFGSPSAAHALMHLNIIDDYWLFINPVLLGNGIPLFKNIEQRVGLKLTDTKTFSSGVVMVHYEKI